MKLVRLVTLYLEPSTQKWRSWKMRFERVNLETMWTKELENGKKLRLVLAAQIDLAKNPNLTADGFIQVPEESRKEAEKAVETAANLIAVCEMCKRSISSPTPCIAFIPLNADERAWLDRTKGILSSLPFRGGVKFSVQEEITQTDLRDRLDGVALLAEALSQDHVSGKFHELLRVFERAFGLSSSALIDPLSEFLSSKGFTKNEVKTWIFDLRHPATHVDKRDDFALESDIRPVISRMELAVYDVLFNKLEWRNASTSRRNVFSPLAMWDSTSGKLSVVQGATATTEWQLLDQFGAYPIDLMGVITDLPEGWWSKDMDKGGVASASIE